MDLDNNQNHTIQTWDKLAEKYRDKFMDLELYNDTYDAFCKLIISPSPQIFEIGCGPGNVTRYLSSMRSDFSIEATDAAPNMIAVARSMVPSAKFWVMDCREMDNMKDKYDGIICGFCMPYLSKDECIALIVKCSALLNIGGIFYFSTIEGDYSQSHSETSSDGQYSMMVYLHQEDYLRASLEENNFDIVDVIRLSYQKSDQIQSTHIVFISRKK